MKTYKIQYWNGDCTYCKTKRAAKLIAKNNIVSIEKIELVTLTADAFERAVNGVGGYEVEAKEIHVTL